MAFCPTGGRARRESTSYTLPMDRTVAVIGGTGRSGHGLTMRLARAGVPVVIGSRDAGRAAEVGAALGERVREAGGGATITGASNVDAAGRADMAFLTLPYAAQRMLLPDLAAPLAGKVVVSTAVPVRFDPDLGPVAVAMPAGSAAEEAAVLLPSSRLVAAMHTVSSAHLGRLELDLDEDVLLVGDDAEAKSAVAGIVDLLPGLRAVDGGRLGNARLAEQLAVLLLSVNRLAGRTAGIRFTNLPGRAAPPPKA